MPGCLCDLQRVSQVKMFFNKLLFVGRLDWRKLLDKGSLDLPLKNLAPISTAMHRILGILFCYSGLQKRQNITL